MDETTVYFATNRRPDDDQHPTEFTDEFVPDLTSFRVGTATLKGSRLFEADCDKLAKRVSVAVAPEAMDPNDARASRVGSDEMFARVRREMKAGADAIVMIHGFNYTFKGAAARAIQLRQWLTPEKPSAFGNPLPPIVLLFAWPSRGQGVAPKLYEDDRLRAQASGAALGRALLKATDFLRAIKRDERCNGSIHLIAHSMGNWALRGAVQYMRTFVGNNIPPLFDEVILTAADEDDNALHEDYKLAPILRGCRRVTVYFNPRDTALKASDSVMGNPDRLGRSGPRDRARLSPKIDNVNVSPSVIWGDDAAGEKWQLDQTGHQYYRSNPKVQADMLAVLDGIDGQEIPGRRPAQDGAGYVLPAG
jgi:esterase/lipase superfamily enzyme